MNFDMTDSQVKTLGYELLASKLGDVNAERFIVLTSRAPSDYTEWRREHLFIGETVDSLMDMAEELEKTTTRSEMTI